MKKAMKFFPLISAVLGLIAVISLFLPAFTFAGNEFLGFTSVFGYTKTIKGVGSFELLGFSFMNLLTYVLLIAGLVLALLTFFKVGPSVLAWVAAACLILAGVFFFLVIPFTTVADGWATVFAAKENKDLWELGYGAIVAAITSLLGGVVTAVYAIANK